VGPNVEGNRRAAPMMTEDQSMCRRVRLTVGLGPSAYDCEPNDERPMRGTITATAIGLLARSVMPGLEARHAARAGRLDGARPDR
jgi:hypothetical protein